MTPQEKALWDRQTLRLTPGGAGVSLMREDYKDGLRLLLVAALCVLLVACANIANLLLARGLRGRPPDGHARCSRRIARAAGAEGAGGEPHAELCSAPLRALPSRMRAPGSSCVLRSPGRNWVPVDAAPSTPVLLFALGISLITGVVFGMAPAWMTSHAEPIEALRGANRSVAGSRGIFGTAGRRRRW